jgi:hypothetical protein
MTRRTPWTRRDVEGAGEEAPPPTPDPGACLLLDGTTGVLLLEVVVGCLELEGTY